MIIKSILNILFQIIFLISFVLSQVALTYYLFKGGSLGIYFIFFQILLQTLIYIWYQKKWDKKDLDSRKSKKAVYMNILVRNIIVLPLVVFLYFLFAFLVVSQLADAWFAANVLTAGFAFFIVIVFYALGCFLALIAALSFTFSYKKPSDSIN